MTSNKKELTIMIILALAERPLFGMQIVTRSRIFRPISRTTVYIRLSMLEQLGYVTRREGIDEGAWRPMFELTEQGRSWVETLLQ